MIISWIKFPNHQTSSLYYFIPSTILRFQTYWTPAVCTVSMFENTGYKVFARVGKLTLTWDSVMPSAYASFARSGPARYLVCSKVFSSAKICCPLNVGLVCFFLPSLSWFELFTATREKRKICIKRRLRTRLQNIRHVNTSITFTVVPIWPITVSTKSNCRANNFRLQQHCKRRANYPILFEVKLLQTEVR